MIQIINILNHNQDTDMVHLIQVQFHYHLLDSPLYLLEKFFCQIELEAMDLFDHLVGIIHHILINLHHLLVDHQFHCCQY